MTTEKTLQERAADLLMEWSYYARHGRRLPSVVGTEEMAISLRALSPPEPAGGLRAALAPFAKIADEYDDRETDAFQLWQDAHEPSTRVTLGQCRKARAALRAMPLQDHGAK